MDYDGHPAPAIAQGYRPRHAAFERARANVTDAFDDPKLQRLKQALLREGWLRDMRGRTY